MQNKIGFILLQFFFLCVFALQCFAQEKNQSLQTWNLKDIDIKFYIETMAKQTGKNFIVDPKVSGKVNVISEKPLDNQQSYKLFLTVLAVHGYKVVSDDENISILPESKGTTLNNRFDKTLRETEFNELVITVIPVKYVMAETVVKALQPLVSRYSHISVFNDTNSILISAPKEKIVVVQKLVKELDKSTLEPVEVITLEHAEAVALVRTITQILKRTVKDNVAMELAEDTRTNSILVKGGSQEKRVRLRALIAELDVPVEETGYLTEVIYLKHLQAEDFSPIIEGLLKGYSDKRVETGTARTVAFSSGQTTAAQQQSRGRSAEQGTFVQFEKTTNSLIITSPYAMMRVIKSVIARLDIRRPQVLIEAVLAEITVDRTKELGLEWNPAGTPKGRFNTRFSGITNTTTTSTNLADDPSKGVIPNLASGLSFGYFRKGSLQTLLRALAKDNDATVLATPNIVALDNEKAEIKVGDKITFATSRSNNAATSGGALITSLEREDVGLQLTIEPQIIPDGSVRMKIDQVLANVIQGSTSSEADNKDTRERSISTTVMVDDGEILVLGGLIQNELKNVIDKVPILGDIPVVGLLFRNEYQQKQRQNLMIFLRPKILWDKEDSVMVSTDKYNILREKQVDTMVGMYHNKDVIQDPSILKPLDGNVVLPEPFGSITY